MAINIKDYIANVENWPKEGIIFRDITPLLADGEAFKYTVDMITAYAKRKGVTKIVGPEARGFMIGCPVATALGVGFIPVRKPGKLPRAKVKEEYSLEYGSNILCIHQDAVNENDKVLIVDDLLATGGTALASAHLCEYLGAEVVGMAFIVDLVDLKAKETVLQDYEIFTLTEYEGE